MRHAPIDDRPRVDARRVPAHRTATAQPRRGPKADAGAAGSGAGSGDAKPIAYRTDASGFHVEPKLTGSGKTSLVASEDSLRDRGR